MPKPNVLFLIHGIGNHSNGWALDAIKTLGIAAKSFPGFANANQEDPLGGEIEFVPITYNEIFDALLERFKDLAAQFEPLNDAQLPSPIKKIEKLSGEFDKETVRYLGDAILYRGFRLVRNTVLLKVMATIARKIQSTGLSRDGTPVKYGVLGHSLGTTVAHDALHLLATTPWLQADDALAKLKQLTPELGQNLADRVGNNPFSPKNFMFDAVFMVSNTSRLLFTTDEDPYHSTVRPVGPGDMKQAVCGTFYNFDHRLDPVSKLCKFRIHDAWRPDVEGAQEPTLDHLYEPNVHNLSHYLLHPYVYGPILGHLAPSFSRADWREAWNRVDNGTFSRWGPEYSAESLRKKAEAALTKLLPKSSSDENIGKLIAIYESLKDLEEA